MRAGGKCDTTIRRFLRHEARIVSICLAAPDRRRYHDCLCKHHFDRSPFLQLLSLLQALRSGEPDSPTPRRRN